MNSGTEPNSCDFSKVEPLFPVRGYSASRVFFARHRFLRSSSATSLLTMLFVTSPLSIVFSTPAGRTGTIANLAIVRALTWSWSIRCTERSSVLAMPMLIMNSQMLWYYEEVKKRVCHYFSAVLSRNNASCPLLATSLLSILDPYVSLL